MSTLGYGPKNKQKYYLDLRYGIVVGGATMIYGIVVDLYVSDHSLIPTTISSLKYC